jgi:hypothetical protein
MFKPIGSFRGSFSQFSVFHGVQHPLPFQFPRFGCIGLRHGIPGMAGILGACGAAHHLQWFPTEPDRPTGIQYPAWYWDIFGQQRLAFKPVDQVKGVVLVLSVIDLDARRVIQGAMSMSR